MKKRYSEEQILRILSEGNSGKPVAEILREYGVSGPTFYRWKSQYGGLDGSQLKRMKELEVENNRLKRIVADQALDIVMLKDINSKNW